MFLPQKSPQTCAVMILNVFQHETYGKMVLDSFSLAERRIKEIKDQIKAEYKFDATFSFHCVDSNDFFDNLLKIHSPLSKIKHILEYCLRLIQNSETIIKIQASTSDFYLPLTLKEVKITEEFTICWDGKTYFHDYLK